MLKEQKGITLVALIITIIVMLILAGVSISLVVGEDGVLTQAQSVEPAQIKGALKEAIAMASGDIIANHYGDTAKAGWSEVDTVAEFKNKIISNFQSYASATLTLCTDDAGNTAIDNAATDLTTIKSVKAVEGDHTVIVKVDVENKGTYYTIKVAE